MGAGRLPVAGWLSAAGGRADTFAGWFAAAGGRACTGWVAGAGRFVVLGGLALSVRFTAARFTGSAVGRPVAVVEGRPRFTDAKLLRFSPAFRSWDVCTAVGPM